MSLYCKLCKIHCASQYGLDQHLSGKKHRAYASSSQTGRTSSDMLDTILANSSNFGPRSITPYSGQKRQQAARLSSPLQEPTLETFKVEFKLGKSSSSDSVKREAPAGAGGISEDQQQTAPTEKPLFPIFAAAKRAQEQPNKPKKKATKQQFPDCYRDLFKRKRNVNLYISGGSVLWEFAYNSRVIEAIKTHVPGRQWNPAMKKWSCPMESLPTCIALYQHMGRTPDDSLKERAKEMLAACGGTDPKDMISLTVSLSDASNNNMEEQTRLGSVDVSFLYNADIVAAIKHLPPTQRSFDKDTKHWPIDLLALPELLEHLQPLGYIPGETLESLCTCLQDLDPLLHSSPTAATEPDEQSSSNTAPPFDESVATATLSEQPVDKAQRVAEELEKLWMILLDQKEGQHDFDRSDCGSAKKRKLSSSQKVWALKKAGLYDYDDYSDRCYNVYGFGDDDSGDCCSSSFGDVPPSFSQMARQFVRRTAAPPPPTDCDCGHSYKRSGGRHVCRYFGTFHCHCGNRWTSAYTWKGETQACRSCNAESMPIKKEILDGSGSIRCGGGGPHDSSRCSQCRKLGYNCRIMS